MDACDEEDGIATAPKRAASCRYDDLSCLEATLFDRGPDPASAFACEAESKFSRSAASCSTPATCLHELTDMIRAAFASENIDRPYPNYMARHGQQVQALKYLEPGMRMVAVSWLVEVTSEYSLQQETLFLAVNLIDRFLSHARAVPRNHLQLTAVACMMIAAKHEEKESHPSAQSFTNIADNCFQVGDLLRMESLVLQTLSFRVMRPNSYTILCLLVEALDLDPRDTALAIFLTELSMLEYRLLHYQPSVIAAASVLLAQARRDEAVQQILLLSGYSLSVLMPCAEELLSLQQQAFDTSDPHSPLMAVKEKYRDMRWHCVSHQAPAEFASLWSYALP